MKYLLKTTFEVFFNFVRTFKKLLKINEDNQMFF
jgi:hypothetical protein